MHSSQKPKERTANASIFFSFCCESPDGAKNAEALYVAPATLVAIALAVKSDSRGERMGSKGKDHKLRDGVGKRYKNQIRSAKRGLSLCRVG